MASNEELSYAFLDAHPADAARVLERLAVTEAGALLQLLPVRLAAPVLRHMLPLAGARCLEQLEDAQAAGLLQGMGSQAGVAMLRHLGAERRARLLALIPATLTLAYELLLGYPEQTVGAWMDTHAVALPSDMTVGESLDRVRRADETLLADPYVINRSQHLLGYVELADLLRANPAITLEQLVRPCSHRLPAQSLLTSLHDHPGWREVSILPVVERGDRLVGAFSHAALQRALLGSRKTDAPSRTEDALSGLAGAYWLAVSLLIKALVGQLPARRHEEKS
jgi:Mg/Co/Ni transporter MgtE